MLHCWGAVSWTIRSALILQILKSPHMHGFQISFGQKQTFKCIFSVLCVCVWKRSLSKLTMMCLNNRMLNLQLLLKYSTITIWVGVVGGEMRTEEGERILYTSRICFLTSQRYFQVLLENRKVNVFLHFWKLYYQSGEMNSGCSLHFHLLVLRKHLFHWNIMCLKR